MRKEFNITDSCNPEWHYMVDSAKRFEAMKKLIANSNCILCIFASEMTVYF